MWVREGECNRCGECCVGEPPGEHGLGLPSVHGFCPLYALLSDGKYGCTGHHGHPFYLGGCVDWPTDPVQIADKPSCSYSFKWVD